MKSSDCHIVRRHLEDCFEFVLMPGSAPEALGPDWPGLPGAQRRACASNPELLHFAPRRWLVPEPTPTLAARLDVYVAGGIGAMIDVEGKWEVLTLSGVGAERMLAVEIEVDFTLAERQCAATSLFGCPVILARDGTSFELWIQRSYASSCFNVLESICNRMRLADVSSMKSSNLGYSSWPGGRHDQLTAHG